MTFNDCYYMADGYAYSRYGVENFTSLVPRDHARRLFRAWLHTRGFKWIESGKACLQFARMAAKRARQEEDEKPPCPSNPQACPYRKSIQADWYTTPRPTALRVESIVPLDRCGFLLKEGYIGGHFFDYNYCLNP